MIIIANHIFSGMNRTELKAVSWFDLAIEALGWYADASKICLRLTWALGNKCEHERTDRLVLQTRHSQENATAQALADIDACVLCRISPGSARMSRFGLAVRRKTGKRKDVGSSPLRLSFFQFLKVVLYG